MKSKLIYFLLGLTVLLGLGLRIFQVSNLPSILNRDEAALAYNGLLLSEVGKDEFGRAWPLTLESFGDYKLPGYPYTLALLFKFLPVNDWTVRLPSVVAGTALIGISFFFAKNILSQLWVEAKSKTGQKYLSKLILLLSLGFAFLIAITPIFTFYSRIAFEANVALALFVGALTLIFRPLKKDKQTSKKLGHLKLDLLASFLVLVATLFYNTPLLLLPFIILIIPVWRGFSYPQATWKLWQNWQSWLPLVLALSVIFGVMFLKLSSISSQKAGITIFSDETLWHQSTARYQELSSGSILQKILANRYVFFAQLILQNYIDSFSPQFLVKEGGSHPWHQIPGSGHIYRIIFVMFWVGLAGFAWKTWTHLKNLIQTTSLKSKKLHLKFSTRWLIIIYLLLISLIPAVITVDAPHATRSLIFFYLLSFVSMLGIYWTITKINLKPLLIIVLLILSIESGGYFYKYFAQYPQQQPPSLQIGFDQTISQVETKYSKDNVAIVDPSGYQYILTAWYLKTTPESFLNTIVKQLPDRIGFKYGEQLTHYHFIAQVEDRSPEELIMVEWNGQKWLINEF